MFLKKYDLLEKYQLVYQTIYLEHSYIILLLILILLIIIINDITMNQYYFCNFNYFCTFSPFLSLVILFSVLPSIFIVSDVKSSRLYPFLILNLTLFSILFTYICTDGLSVFSQYLLKIYQYLLKFVR